MLLNLLSKEEKMHFIDLLRKVLIIDGPANEFEKQIQAKFQSEMGSEISKYRMSLLTTEKLIEYFSAKSKGVKNIVYYNLVAASLYDEFYSVEEHILLDQIQKAFEITEKKKIELVKAVYAERDLKEKVKRIVNE